MAHNKIILASRRSPLALRQTNIVADAIHRLIPNTEVDILTLSTRGDDIQNAPLTDIGGKELFINGIRQALLDGRANAAVHSLKDMAAHPVDNFTLAAIGFAEDARDAVVSPSGKKLQHLPAGATIGTSSPRRLALLQRHFPTLNPVAIRGNIHSRLEKLQRQSCDALILAVSGLKRMQLQQHISDYLSPEVFVPAAGQGLIAVECLTAQTTVLSLLSRLDDNAARQRANAERTFTAAMQGDCHTPLGAHAAVDDNGKISLHAFYATAGGQYCDALVTAADAETAGRQAANEILRQQSAHS